MTDWNTMVAELGQIPELPGARCRNRHELFDATIVGRRGAPPDDLEYARSAAVRLCRACPALDPCRAWFEALPATQRPRGVVAGSLNNPTKEPPST